MSKVIYEDHAIQVIQHRPGANGVLIGPPDAGHGHGIVDYAPGQSIIQQALENTTKGVAHINWKSATRARGGETIQDKVEQTLQALDVTGTTHLVGLCQAGWLFARVATQFPDYVTRLALAGAPIDTSLGESSLKKAQEVPFWKYQMIVAMNGGIMPGWLMNLSWKSANPKMHYWDRIVAPTDQTDRFYAWYDDVQNLAGGWYLEIMKELFLENTFKDTLDIQCPVHVMTGMRDEITPPEQTLAILEHVRSGVICSRECDAGHLGVFTAKKAMPMWTEYFQSC